MNSASYLRDSLKWAHELIELTMDDATQAHMDYAPPGTANPLGATLAHAFCAEDGVLNATLKGGVPMFSSSWAGKTGITDPQWHSEAEWARSVHVDVRQARAYGQALAKAGDDYLGGLSDAELDRELDLTAQGLGKRSVGWVIHALLIGHLHNMAGEMSALKGIQGARGYPF